MIDTNNYHVKNYLQKPFDRIIAQFTLKCNNIHAHPFYKLLIARVCGYKLLQAGINLSIALYKVAPTLELKYDLYKVAFSRDLHGSLATEQHMTKKRQHNLN